MKLINILSKREGLVETCLLRVAMSATGSRLYHNSSVVTHDKMESDYTVRVFS